MNDRKPQTRKNKPYSDLNIISIVTGLQGRWEYSPKFKNAYATTSIQLTGSRRKDYLEAEKKSNCKHIPKQTVWHHVWEKQQTNEYTMQLVDFKQHLSTIPHAGGCKLWEIEHGRKYKRITKNISNPEIYIHSSLIHHYKINQMDDYIQVKLNSPKLYLAEKEYNDFIIDAIFSNSEKKELPIIKHKSRGIRIYPWGVDPFGNLFYIDKKKKLYFLDMETGTIFKLQVTIDKLLHL